MADGWQIKFRGKHLYWLTREEFSSAKRFLIDAGWKVKPTRLTPCQVLKANGKTVVYASPEAWSRVCVRPGSWYRESSRFGHFMMVSERRLPPELDAFLDAEISESGFRPTSLPGREALEELVDSDEYRMNRPPDWEHIGIRDAVLFKVLFTVTRFWRQGDTLNEHWLGQRANHANFANFLTGRFMAEVGGEEVPYSVSEGAGVCSSCVEFFNLVRPDSRKLVRTCPGVAILAGAPRDTYLDVKPRNVAAVSEGRKAAA